MPLPRIRSFENDNFVFRLKMGNLGLLVIIFAVVVMGVIDSSGIRTWTPFAVLLFAVTVEYGVLLIICAAKARSPWETTSFTLFPKRWSRKK
jgi:hypothetical protein